MRLLKSVRLLKRKKEREKKKNQRTWTQDLDLLSKPWTAKLQTFVVNYDWCLNINIKTKKIYVDKFLRWWIIITLMNYYYVAFTSSHCFHFAFVRCLLFLVAKWCGCLWVLFFLHSLTKHCCFGFLSFLQLQPGVRPRSIFGSNFWSNFCSHCRNFPSIADSNNLLESQMNVCGLWPVQWCCRWTWRRWSAEPVLFLQELA